MTLRHKRNLFKHLKACHKRRKEFAPQFNIKTYARDSASGTHPSCPHSAGEALKRNLCRTSACFLGFASITGFKLKPGESWSVFADRVFGSKEFQVWRLLFHYDHVNDLNAAIKRAAYFLDKGLPFPNDPFYDGYPTWEAPKSYRIPWKKLEQAYA